MQKILITGGAGYVGHVLTPRLLAAGYEGTVYNKFKGMCEPVLWKHMADDFTCVAIRPATVCGYSPRTRLDLSVNILTNHAVNKGTITVFGGSQMRPNLHIDDICELYVELLDMPAAEIAGET